MFDYTIFPDYSTKEFKKYCQLVESSFPDAKKDNLLVDVDDTEIQAYHVDSKKIVVYNDYEVGAVYIKSEVDLSEILS